MIMILNSNSFKETTIIAKILNTPTIVLFSITHLFQQVF